MVSVVIPALNEAKRLPGLLRALGREPALAEIIVVDGGSEDETVTLARAGGAVVLRSAPGRGGQLRLGAERARGEVILFLHADTVFPAGGLTALAERLALEPELVGGNFRIVFDGSDDFSRWLTRFYAWFRRRGLYYGDSGIFIRSEAYRALGGIRPIALMEDYDLCRRLQRLGPTCCIEETPLVSSSRRFAGLSGPALSLGPTLPLGTSLKRTIQTPRSGSSHRRDRRSAGR